METVVGVERQFVGKKDRRGKSHMSDAKPLWDRRGRRLMHNLSGQPMTILVWPIRIGYAEKRGCVVRMPGLPRLPLL
jgi:hypothetical protein